MRIHTTTDKHASRKPRFTISFIAVCALTGSLIVAAQTPPTSETIITSTGTFVLPPVESAIDETSLRQFGQTAKLAFVGKTTDAEVSNKEAIKLAAQIGKAKARFDQANNAYLLFRRPIDLRTKLLLEATAAYETDGHKQEHDVDVYDAVPIKQRNPAEKKRLDDWRQRLISKRAELEKVQAAIKADALKMLPQLKLLAAETEKQFGLLEALQVRKHQLITELGKSYRQLEFCANYLKRVSQIANDRNYRGSTTPGGFQIPRSDPTLKQLNGSMEQLKRLGDVTFDGKKP